MRSVIEKVLEAETEAKRILEKARSEAESILADAREKAETKLAAAQAEAQANSERSIQSEVERAEREKQERLAAALEKIHRNLGLDEESLQKAVEAVVHCVCGLPPGKPQNPK